MKQLILASHNAHKVREIRELLEGQPVEVLSLSDIGWTEEIEENGSSFEENALIKARRIYADTGRAVLADDSGLEVDALGGGPGIYSSRFMGEETPYEQKNAAIIARVEGLPEEERGADFRCVMAFVHPDADGHAEEQTAEAAAEQPADAEAPAEAEQTADAETPAETGQTAPTEEKEAETE